MLPQFRKSDVEGAKTAPALGTALPPAPPSGSSLGTRQPMASLRPGAHGTGSIIGPDLIIQGNLVSKGEVQIDGEVQGDIYGTHIVVGEKAKITGGIIAEECVIRGHVLGTVRGKRVLLQTQSHVEGDIYHHTLAIEQGAFFEGKSRRSDDPLGAGRSDQAPSQGTQSLVPPSIGTPLEPPLTAAG